MLDSLKKNLKKLNCKICCGVCGKWQRITYIDKTIPENLKDIRNSKNRNICLECNFLRFGTDSDCMDFELKCKKKVQQSIRSIKL